MGFPKRNAEGPASATFAGPECTLQSGGFTCPRCLARLPTLPCSCFICGLTCVLSPHIARSYHHLFPLPVFPDLPPAAQAALHGCGGTPQAPPAEAPTKGTDGRSTVNGADPFVRVVLPAPPLHCFGCLQPLAGEAAEAVTQCPDCSRLFCLECDGLLHDVVHNCPGCECLPLQGNDS